MKHVVEPKGLRRWQARSQEVQLLPNSKSCIIRFQVTIKVFMCKPKKYFSANQGNCLRNLSYFAFYSNLTKVVWFTNRP